MICGVGIVGAMALAAGCVVSNDDDGTVGSTGQAESAGGLLADGPAVASPAPHRYDVFVEGGDGVLYHRTLNNGVWNDYAAIDWGITAKPAAVSWGPGRIDVVARGSDNTLWH